MSCKLLWTCPVLYHGFRTLHVVFILRFQHKHQGGPIGSTHLWLQLATIHEPKIQNEFEVIIHTWLICCEELQMLLEHKILKITWVLLNLQSNCNYSQNGPQLIFSYLKRIQGNSFLSFLLSSNFVRFTT